MQSEKATVGREFGSSAAATTVVPFDLKLTWTAENRGQTETRSGLKPGSELLVGRKLATGESWEELEVMKGVGGENELV